MNRLAVAVVLLASIEGIALAQPGATEPIPAPAPAPVGEQLSENTALGLSLGGTVLSWGLIVGASAGNNSTLGSIGLAGVMFAPSFGHWYADKYATRGLGLRAAGIGAAFLGALVALSECPISFGHDDSGPCEESALGPAIAIAGAGLFVWGTIDDIATAPRRVRQRNARAQLAFAPSLRSDGGGVTVVGRF